VTPFQPVQADYQGGGTSEPELCVWKSGKFHITPAADRQYFADVDHVAIHHDPDRDGVVIGFEPAPDDDGGHVRTLTRGEGDGADVNALSVLDRLGIDKDEIEEAQRFDLEAVDEGPVVAMADIAPLANGGVETVDAVSQPGELPEPEQDAEEHLEEIENEDVPPAEPGPEEEAAAAAVEDLDDTSDSPDEPKGDSARETFEEALEETDENSDGRVPADEITFDEADTPDWLDEGSFYSAAEEADDLEGLRDVLGWRDGDGDLGRLVERLDVDVDSSDEGDDDEKYCGRCGHGPTSERGIKIHNGRTHDGDAKIVDEPPEDVDDDRPEWLGDRELPLDHLDEDDLALVYEHTETIAEAVEYFDTGRGPVERELVDAGIHETDPSPAQRMKHPDVDLEDLDLVRPPSEIVATNSKLPGYVDLRSVLDAVEAANDIRDVEDELGFAEDDFDAWEGLCSVLWELGLRQDQLELLDKDERAEQIAGLRAVANGGESDG
jgi:hypothetical protein